MLEEVIIRNYRFRLIQLAMNLSIVFYGASILVGVLLGKFVFANLLWHLLVFCILVAKRLILHHSPKLVSHIFVGFLLSGIMIGIFLGNRQFESAAYTFLPLVIVCFSFILGFRSGFILYLVSQSFLIFMWYRGLEHPNIYNNVFFVRSIACVFALICSYFFDSFTSGCIREIQKSRKTIEQSERLSSLGLMAGGIAHEMSNPLAISKGSLSIIKQDNLPNEKKKKWLDKMETAITRMEDIIASIRVFSGNHNNDGLRTFTLDSVIDIIKEESHQRLSDLSISMQLLDSQGEITCNHFHMVVILKTLLDNSADAIQEFGPQTGGHVIISHYMKGRQDIITVSDNANLPDDTQLDHVFDPFYTTKDIGKGMGLNLALVHSIINLYGWQIEVTRTSTETIFMITMEPIDNRLEELAS